MRAGEGVNSYIGKEVVLQGEISGTEDVYFDGKFEGTISLEDSKLTVGPNARIQGNIQSRDVIVLGAVQGNITATGRVEMRHTSSLTGDLFSVHLVVEDGAVLVGKVELSLPVRPAVVSGMRPAESTLYAVYSEVQEKKEPQHETSDVAIAIASNG